MEKIHPAAWIGLIINVVVSLFAIGEFNDIPGFFLLFVAGGGLTLVGIIMLAMGLPAGGIVGAVGSAVFVPIGLVGMVGCMRSRQNLLKDLRTVDSKLVDTVFGDGHVRKPGDGDQQPSSFYGIREDAAVTPAEDVSPSGAVPLASNATVVDPATTTHVPQHSSFYDTLNKGAVSGSAVTSPGTAVSPDIQTSQPDIARQDRPVITNEAQAQSSDPIGETPASDFRFKDQRALVGIMFGIAIVVFVGMSMSLYVDISGPIIMLVVLGGLNLWTQSRIVNLRALAFYGDHLVCMPSMAAWADERTIVYDHIKSASIKGNKGLIIADRFDGEGTEETKILFNGMDGDTRPKAKAAFAAKMRELRVPFEES